MFFPFLFDQIWQFKIKSATIVRKILSFRSYSRTFQKHFEISNKCWGCKNVWEIPIMLFIILNMIFRFSQCRTNYIASNAGIIWFSAKKCYLIPYLFYIHCYTLTNHHYLLSAHIICTVTFVPFGSLQGVPINMGFQWHFFDDDAYLMFRLLDVFYTTFWRITVHRRYILADETLVCEIKIGWYNAIVQIKNDFKFVS